MPRIRAQQITIDIPRTNSEPWINIVVQLVEDDGGIVDRYDFSHRALGKVATEIVTFTDPVLQKQTSVSVYGLAEAIKEAVVHWLVADHNGTYLDGNINLGA